MNMKAGTRARAHRHAGFSLVEVLVVMAVVLILSMLAYPTYTAQVTKARRSEGQVALLESMQHQERYYAQYNTYLPFSAAGEERPQTDGGEKGFRWWSGATASASAYELSARACDDQPATRCIELHAQPGTDRVDGRFRDPECGTLILASSGAHRATGAGKRCWP
jgi:type IV pilus assembly protein PilE